jgi:hypothetical protein
MYACMYAFMYVSHTSIYVYDSCIKFQCLHKQTFACVVIHIKLVHVPNISQQGRFPTATWPLHHHIGASLQSQIELGDNSPSLWLPVCMRVLCMYVCMNICVYVSIIRSKLLCQVKPRFVTM